MPNRTKKFTLLYDKWAKTYDTDLEKSVQVTKEQSIQLRCLKSMFPLTGWHSLRNIFSAKKFENVLQNK